MKKALVILAIASSLSLATAPADAGLLRDVARRTISDAKFTAHLGRLFVKCVGVRILRTHSPSCT